MKKIAALICTVICLFALNGCSRFAGIPETDDEWGIVLVAKDVTPTSMTIVCAQRDVKPDGKWMSGSYFRLEVIEDGDWVRLDPKIRTGWTTEGWIIRVNDVVEWEESWERLYGELSPGQYRIVKNILYSHATNDYEEKEYFAEFTIGDSTEG